MSQIDRGHCCAQICEAFSANRYPFPEDPARQRQMNAEVTARLRELQTTIEAGAQGGLPWHVLHSLRCGPLLRRVV
jgi:hypothetical protein